MMPSATLRINRADRDLLRALAEREGEPVRVVLTKAIESYRRQRFLEEANLAFAGLKSDPRAWRDELEERSLWDSTLRDGATPE